MTTFIQEISLQTIRNNGKDFFLIIVLITVSCKQEKNKIDTQIFVSIKNEKLKPLDVNNLPFGNQVLIKYHYDSLNWFDELHFGEAILGHKKLKNITSKYEGVNIKIKDTVKSFYLPNNVKIDYVESNKVNSDFKILYTANNYSLCYITTIGNDLSKKVFASESEETRRGYLVTINSHNKMLSVLEVSNLTEYYTQSYKGEYLGAMYIQNKKTFYVDKDFNIYLYNFMVKGHDLSSEYKLISSEKYKLSENGFFIIK